MVSTIGPFVAITGQIVCARALVHGRVRGDVHASKLVIAARRRVFSCDVTIDEGAIEGEFNGTLRANTVNVTGSAVVEGELHHPRTVRSG
jgi:cytoskeletal protein CcmA (bactofilin family)